MTEKYYSLIIIFLIAAFIKVNAQDAPVLTFNIPYQNNINYNRFLMNPAFSFVRENNTYVSLYHRNQWVQYNDSPKVYLLSYTGRFSKKEGLGFALYKQNIGVIGNFGGIGNYSYNVKLKEHMNLTLGFNVAYYNSGVDKNKAITGEPDPRIIEMQNNSLLSIKPGINFSFYDFDFGLYAENFIDYDFKSNGLAKDYANKTYSGHAMYTHKLLALKNLFERSEVKLGVRGEMSEENGFGLSGLVLVNFPRMGWVQASVDDFYGLGVGIGFHFTKRLSLGYVYELSTKEGLVALGPTHEVTLVFALKDRMAMKARGEIKNDSIPQGEELLKENIEEEVKDSIPQKKEKAKATGNIDKKAELEKLRMELSESDQHLLDALIREDSLTEIKEAQLEKKIKNLKDYAEREKQAQKQGGIKTVELKNRGSEGETDEPKTLEELKRSKDGYYVVAKPKNSEDGDDEGLTIERHDSFVEAANASEKKKKKEKNKEVYIVHVENTPETVAETEAIRKSEAKRGKTAPKNAPKGTPKSTSQNNYEDEDEPQPRESVKSARNVAEDTFEDNSEEGIEETRFDEARADEEASAEEAGVEEETPTVRSAGPKPKSGVAKPGTKPAATVATGKPKTGESPKSNDAPKTIESLNTEQDIKDFFSKKTDKVRQAPKQGNKLMVDGVEPGYYIIANVFSEQENTDKFIRKMKDRGIEAGFFLNPDNGFRYVYLKKHSSWREALISYYSNVNNTYFESVWLMSINTN